MNNILLITKREYLTQVKKKSFMVFTVLAPLMIVAFGVLISYMFKANQTSSSINVIDKSGMFAGKLKSNDKITYIFVPEANEKVLKSSLNEMQETDGLLIIPKLQNKNFDSLQNHTQLLINKKIGFDTQQKISSDLKKIIQPEKVKALGLNENQIKDIDKDFSLKIENIASKDKADSDLTFGVKSALSMLLMYVTFMFIIIYGVRVMRSVLEEKNNRVVEIIISSVKPFQLMMGKILGVTLVALTQFIIWILMSVMAALFLNTGFAALQQQMSGAETADTMSQLDLNQYATEISHTLLQMNFPLIIVVFILFFLLGYIFYSSFYAAIGSAVDNETETQQFTLFAVIPLTIGMYGSFSIINNPDGPMAFWLSIIPFTSPVAMVARIPFGVPIWEIVVSFLLLAGASLLMIFIASKIYRIGILMYGNKASLKEIIRWIRN